MQESLFLFNLLYNSFATSLAISMGNPAVFDSLIIFNYYPWLTIATATLGSTAGQTTNLYVGIMLTKKNLAKTQETIKSKPIIMALKHLILLSCGFLGQFGSVVIFIMPCIIRVRLISSITYILLSNLAFYSYKFYKLKLVLQFLS